MHIAIIMDGNGRWAKQRGLPRIRGHQEGINRIRELLEYAPRKGVDVLTLFAFSTENWRRPKEEVGFLFSAFENYLRSSVDDLDKKNIRIKVIGERGNLPKSLVEAISQTEERLKDKSGLTLLIAFNYGGRQEIVSAVKSIIRNNVSVDEINEEVVSQHLFTAGLPDPDLLIRTSGEVRISNFLLWQISYTELYFTPIFWPDFNEQEFDKAIDWFSKRKRRFGGL